MTRLIALIAAIFLIACQRTPDPLEAPPDDSIKECDGHGDMCVSQCCDPGYACQRGLCINGSLDLDFDGYAGHWDCDDYDRETYPGAMERCDERDNDCDGLVDEGVRNDAGECSDPCTDDDADGVTTCAEEPDCDDTNADVHPGAEEVCDGVDNDCNGESDEGFDTDGDGYGACEEGGDCDDTDPTRAPGFIEVCDGVDNDCNGTTDEGDLCGRIGECDDGACRWSFDVVDGDVEHDTGGPDGRGGWCAGPDDPINAVLVSAPAGGTRDFPYGVYDVTLRLKVDNTTLSWGTCGTSARLRVNDRDGDGTGSCEDCWFGGDVALVPAHFATVNQYQEWDLNFSIGPERAGHLVEVVVLRGNCQEVTVCIDTFDIVSH